MSDAGTTYELGSSVYCADAGCGDLLQFVVDPVPPQVTRLVVQATTERTPHLVPFALARTTELGVLLVCDREEFDRLRAGRDGDPRTDPRSDPRTGPGSGPRPGSRASPLLVSAPMSAPPPGVPEMRIKRGDHAHAADGDSRRITGLAVRPRDGRITHVLLARGWGRRLAVPIEVIVGFGSAGVTVGLTRREIDGLGAAGRL